MSWTCLRLRSCRGIGLGLEQSLKGNCFLLNPTNNSVTSYYFSCTHDISTKDTSRSFFHGSLKYGLGSGLNISPEKTALLQTQKTVFDSLYFLQKRRKGTKKSKKRPEYDSDSDSDEDEEQIQGTKTLSFRMQSLRLDGLLKKALGIARNKAEAAFYEGNVRVNGEKPSKKSQQLRLGDEVDLIKGVSPMNLELLNVSRVELLSVREDKDEDDQLLVKVRRTKTLYIENYESDPWKKGHIAE